MEWKIMRCVVYNCSCIGERYSNGCRQDVWVVLCRFVSVSVVLLQLCMFTVQVQD